jgi:Zn-dependent protease with chaperone function
MIGTGLLHGFSQDELKAILAHEFGHFSQKSMKIGVITSRLMSIIGTMVEYAEQEIEKAERSKAEKRIWWQRIFHAASGTMSKLNKLTIKFYNSIGNKHYSLSRYMEFEADSVACRLVGTSVFYSSLCKLDTTVH